MSIQTNVPCTDGTHTHDEIKNMGYEEEPVAGDVSEIMRVYRGLCLACGMNLYINDQDNGQEA